jgi:NADH dehydrogenase
MQVLVLGGGYAGVTVARRLERALPEAVELTVVDESTAHLVQHELHRLVRHPDMIDAISVPFADLFSRASFVQARVIELDESAGRVDLDDGTTLEFDLAAVCLGARTAYYDLPGIEAHSTPLKRVTDAEAVREGFLELVETGSGRAVVGGAGLSGVQIAGELAALATDRGVADAVEVVLLEQADRVAPGFPAHFSEAVHQALLEEGVDVRTGSAVASATAETIELEDGTLDYDQLVWTGGIRGPAPLGDDRPTVPATLRRDEHTFVVGDSARVVDRDGDLLPATAQAAMAEARVAARNIDRLVRHRREGGAFEPRLETVDFEPSGWIVSVGTRTVAQLGPLVFRDGAALAFKTAVGARHLAGVGAFRQAAGLVGDELLTPRWPGRRDRP